jgi:hypothetical protein
VLFRVCVVSPYRFAWCASACSIIKPQIYESTTIQPTLKTETVVQPHLIQQTVVTPQLTNMPMENAPIQEAPVMQQAQPVVQPTINEKKGGRQAFGLGFGGY